MTRSKPFQSLTIPLIFMMLAFSIPDLAAQRQARGSASRGSVRYAGKTSTEGSHRTQTRRGTLDTNTSVDGNKTNRETSAEGAKQLFFCNLTESDLRSDSPVV